jgi:lipoate-protein ligase B
VLHGTGVGLRVRWLGTVPYREAWSLQQALHADPAGGGEDRLLLLEHPPTYTLGRNAEPGNVLVDPRPSAPSWSRWTAAAMSPSTVPASWWRTRS